MFNKFLEKATAEIKNRTSEAITQSLNIATDTLIQGKDTAQSTMIKNGMNVFIKKFGEIKEFKIDTKSKTITISIYLKGEVQDVVVKIESYKFFRDDDDIYYIEIFQISVSRYWIDAIAKTFLIGKKFPVPNSLVIPMKILM
jgi:hypothetical protein